MPPQTRDDSEFHIDHKKLSNRILLALVAGAAFGLLLNLTVAQQPFVQDWIIGGLFHVVGQIFIRGLTMLVVPIVFVSLVTGVASLGDPARLGRISAMAIGLYLITTGIAVSLALAAALIVRPGAGAAPGIAAPHDIAGAPPFSQVLIDLVPRNPIAAMANGDMLPVIVFAILFGPRAHLCRRAGQAPRRDLRGSQRRGDEAGRYRHAGRALWRVRADRHPRRQYRLAGLCRASEICAAGAGGARHPCRRCLSGAHPASSRASARRCSIARCATSSPSPSPPPPAAPPFR